MSDTLTIVGTCTEISEKNGWTAFHIDVGSQWPVKLSTKKDTIIAAGRAAGTAEAAWSYNEVVSDKINEHTGNPFVNKYLESVSADTDVGPTTIAPNVQAARPTAQTVSETSHAALRGGDKDRVIARLACLKAAGAALAGTFDVNTEDPGLEVLKMAARFEQWTYRDVDDIPF